MSQTIDIAIELPTDWYSLENPSQLVEDAILAAVAESRVVLADECRNQCRSLW